MAEQMGALRTGSLLANNSTRRDNGAACALRERGHQ
jgi:hypothetical protein